MSDRCNCICRCPNWRTPDCNDLCGECWRAWCLADEKHTPIADRSYVGVYGITTVWAGWLMSRAPELVAEPAGFLQRPEAAPECPICPNRRMVRRPGAWKCYHHEPPSVVHIPAHLPRTPQLRVLEMMR